MAYTRPKNDVEYSRWRLNSILSRRRLTFNPYTVSDERLMEIISVTGWGNEWDITEMVTIRFTRLREVGDYRRFDGIYAVVSNLPEEVFIPLGALIHPVTANDSLHQERSWVGTRAIRNSEDVSNLVGHSFFVSRVVRGVNIRGSGKCAYRLHRLGGSMARDAERVRKAMCAAKIEMLERIMKYPEAACTLSCSRHLFDYETRIHHAMDMIREFPNHRIP